MSILLDVKVETEKGLFSELLDWAYTSKHNVWCATGSEGEKGDCKRKMQDKI